jgi:hypothetical protein
MFLAVLGSYDEWKDLHTTSSGKVSSSSRVTTSSNSSKVGSSSKGSTSSKSKSAPRQPVKEDTHPSVTYDWKAAPATGKSITRKPSAAKPESPSNKPAKHQSPPSRQSSSRRILSKRGPADSADPTEASDDKSSVSSGSTEKELQTPRPKRSSSNNNNRSLKRASSFSPSNNAEQEFVVCRNDDEYQVDAVRQPARLFRSASMSSIFKKKAPPEEQQQPRPNSSAQEEEETDDTDRSDSSKSCCSQDVAPESDDDDDSVLQEERRDVVTSLRPIAVSPGNISPPTIRLVQRWMSQGLPQALLGLRKAQFEVLLQRRQAAVVNEQHVLQELSRVGDYLERLLSWLQYQEGDSTVRCSGKFSTMSTKQKQKMLLIGSGIIALCQNELAHGDRTSLDTVAVVTIPILQILVHILEVIPTPWAARLALAPTADESATVPTTFPPTTDPVLALSYETQLYQAILRSTSVQILGTVCEADPTRHVHLTVLALRVLNTMVPLLRHLKNDDDRPSLLDTLLETVAKFMTRFSNQVAVQLHAVRLLLDVIVHCGLKVHPVAPDEGAVNVPAVVAVASKLSAFRQALRASPITAALQAVLPTSHEALQERATTVLDFILDTNQGQPMDLSAYHFANLYWHDVMPSNKRLEI